MRGIEIIGGGHNFSFLIPAEKYAATHPEFFAERNGERIKPSSAKSALLLSEQLCTTNPDLREELVKNIIEYSHTHPRIKSLNLSPNDGFGWCECKECSKLYDKNTKGELYSLSEHVHQANGIYHQLVKYVNTRLREENCRLTLGFGAYINYCRPSEGMECLDKIKSMSSACIATPSAPREFIGNLMTTHPPINKRIERLESMNIK